MRNETKNRNTKEKGAMRSMNRTMKQSLLFTVAAAAAFAGYSHAGCAYDRAGAKNYAERYAKLNEYNTAYQSFENMGGDCSNFVSQCLIAGGIKIERFAPSDVLAGYSGAKTIVAVSNLLTFMDRLTRDGYIDRTMTSTSSRDVPTMSPGDAVTFWFTGKWGHSGVVVAATAHSYNNYVLQPEDVLINSHSTTNGDNNYHAPLSHFWGWESYKWQSVGFFHITKTLEENDSECTDRPNTGTCTNPNPACCPQTQPALKITAPESF